MSLLNKLTPLRRRCTAKQLRCETRLRKQDQILADIAKSIYGIDSEASAIRNLMQGQRPKNSVLDRASFFAYLMKQAVLRRQIQRLGVQKASLNEQAKEAAKERKNASLERIFWIKKQDKYQYWAKQIRRQERLTQLLREENETQELTTCKAQLTSTRNLM